MISVVRPHCGGRDSLYHRMWQCDLSKAVRDAIVPPALLREALEEKDSLMFNLGLIDFDVERERLAKELKKIEKEVDKVESKLNNSKFTERAPVEVLEEQRERLVEWRNKRDQINEALQSLSGL